MEILRQVLEFQQSAYRHGRDAEVRSKKQRQQRIELADAGILPETNIGLLLLTLYIK
jgi:hypothetical protein